VGAAVTAREGRDVIAKEDEEGETAGVTNTRKPSRATLVIERRGVYFGDRRLHGCRGVASPVTGRAARKGGEGVKKSPHPARSG
jgi:hypothetical protein